MNSIVLDYLRYYGHKYSLSVFSSEIGGESMASLCLSDAHSLLQISDPLTSICLLDFMVNFIEKHMSKEECKNKSASPSTKPIIPAEKTAYEQVTNFVLYFMTMDNKGRGKIKQVCEDMTHLVQENAKLNAELRLKEKKIQELEKDAKRLRAQVESNEKTDTKWIKQMEVLYKQLEESLKREELIQKKYDEQFVQINSLQRELEHMGSLHLSQQRDRNQGKKGETVPKKCIRAAEIQVNSDCDDKHVNNVTMQHIEIKTLPSINSTQQRFAELQNELSQRLMSQADLERDTRDVVQHTRKFLSQIRTTHDHFARRVNLPSLSIFIKLLSFCKTVNNKLNKMKIKDAIKKMLIHN
ncbi:hypothetical protein RFI_07378 [Reticulomyxa filosa]|uniref:Uncharacterized protein n=1 Tax=Reticulomyxa filosa TaxID=46433 RepID=X6NWS4_RETFI|nr:hypothetical protein RFI_07378 [Reticulomyxa filosa]|eukprot:ETO29742.1 hypothetical protein RFI_07378 [Reticulomyxa filosa]